MDTSGRRKRWRSKEPKPDRQRSGDGRPMFTWLRALVILLFGILIVQLVRMQVVQGDEYAQRAEINALREVQIPPARGLIYDRNLRPLVQNSAVFSAAIVPGDLPEGGEGDVYRLLASVIGVPVAEIEERVSEGEAREGAYSPAVIKEGLDWETALILKELEPHAPGLRLLMEPARSYVAGSSLSHVLGYVGPISAEEFVAFSELEYLVQDFIGKSGVELFYEPILRGKPGEKLIEVNAAGRELEVISERRPLDGSNLVLTIDVELQNEVVRVLAQYAGSSDNAAAVVMDVHTGEVLAMVSLPTFDSNIFTGSLSEADLAAVLEDVGKPLVNHTIAERYPPGSSFKPIVGAAALQEGVATAGTVIISEGYILVQNEYNPNALELFPDWAALGALDFYGGLAMSSNVYFYYLAGGNSEDEFRGLGEERVALYARAFGLGEISGIDLPGESAGVVPDAIWKEETVGDPWTLGDTYNFGIGQGYLSVTPLQMVTAVAAIANGGKLLIPHLLMEVRDDQGNILQQVETEVRRTVPVERSYLDIVGEAMLQSVTNGVADTAAVSGLAVAGKTGTAEFGLAREDGSFETHGWFVGFAPYEEPEVAIVVFVQRGEGGQNAAAAAKILDYYFNGAQLAQKSEGGQ